MWGNRCRVEFCSCKNHFGRSAHTTWSFSKVNFTETLLNSEARNIRGEKNWIKCCKNCGLTEKVETNCNWKLLKLIWREITVFLFFCLLIHVVLVQQPKVQTVSDFYTDPSLPHLDNKQQHRCSLIFNSLQVGGTFSSLGLYTPWWIW